MPTINELQKELYESEYKRKHAESLLRNMDSKRHRREKMLDGFSFYRSVDPNMSYCLDTGVAIAFIPKAKVISRRENGEVKKQEVWGEFFTKEKSMIAELDRLVSQSNGKVRAVSANEIQ